MAIGGFLLGAAAGSLLALGSGQPWWLGLPPLAGPGLALAALILHAWAISRGRPREEIAAYLVALAALLPYARGAPTAAEWALALIAAVGFLLAVEMAGAARRLAKLEAAEGREAHTERVAGPLRTAVLVPLVGVAVLLLLTRPIGQAVLGLPGGSLAESVEAAGLFGTAVGAGILASVLGLAAYLRHLRQAS